MEVEEDSRFSWPEFIDFLEIQGYRETFHNTKTSKLLLEYDNNLDNELIPLLQQFMKQNSINLRIINVE
jgi:hypothetical protein